MLDQQTELTGFLDRMCLPGYTGHLRTQFKSYRQFVDIHFITTPWFPFKDIHRLHSSSFLPTIHGNCHLENQRTDELSWLETTLWIWGHAHTLCSSCVFSSIDDDKYVKVGARGRQRLVNHQGMGSTDAAVEPPKGRRPSIRERCWM